MKTHSLLGFAIATAALLALGCAHDAGEPGVVATTAGSADAREQATQGRQLYGRHCASCHGDDGRGNGVAPPLVGRRALPLDPPAAANYRTAQFHTARDVYDFVKTSMPAKAPGSLSEDQYLSILAFGLQGNGIDLTGKAPFTPDTLSAIVLHP
jgi:mono/diheme cytochrome c family protein